MNFRFIFICLYLSFSSTLLYSQHIQYKSKEGKVYSQEQFVQMQLMFDKQGLDFEISDSLVSSDTITRFVVIKKSTDKWSSGNQRFAFPKFKHLDEYIGERFEIERFKDESGISYSKNSLKRKPTVINFWFVACAPCIEEIPYLNELKETFKKKVNFYAITFENQETVRKFLSEQEFNYIHITNSASQLKEIGILAYPVTMVLDDNGIVQKAYHKINDTDTQEISDFIYAFIGR